MNREEKMKRGEIKYARRHLFCEKKYVHGWHEMMTNSVEENEQNRMKQPRFPRFSYRNKTTQLTTY